MAPEIAVCKTGPAEGLQSILVVTLGVRCIQHESRIRSAPSPEGRINQIISRRSRGEDVPPGAAPALDRGLAVLVGAMLALAGCGSSIAPPRRAAPRAARRARRAQASATTSASTASTSTSSCGPKPGVKATGTPINIGTIDTKQPGTDFSERPNMINAYYACVNANGGVNGHPLNYT